MQRLPQALQQAEAGLRALEEQNAIRLDNGNGSRAEVAGTVEAALFGLAAGRGLLERAHEQLREAAGVLSHMGGCRSTAGEDSDDGGEAGGEAGGEG